MKTKNIFLAIIAFTIAIGGAFASMFTQVDVFVVGKRLASSSPTCIQLDVTCDDTTPTSNLCQVQVPVTKDGVESQIAKSDPGMGEFYTYISGCATVLYDQSNQGLQSASPENGTIYELVFP